MTRARYKVLEGLEAVRRRPGMYIGSTDERGLHHLVYEIVDNAIDEALAGFCDDIQVTIFKDGSVEVRDNGPWLPRGHPPEDGPPGGGGLPDRAARRRQVWRRGATRSPAACTAWARPWSTPCRSTCRFNVYQDGKIYQQEYERGKVLYDLKVIGETERTGTTVRFWPDVKTGETPEPGIFETGDFDFDTLKVRLREMAFLNKGIRISPARRARGTGQRARLPLRGRHPLLCRASEPPQDAAVRPAGVHRGRKERLYRGSGPAVERRLQRKRLHLRQQHPTPRRAARIWPACARR